MTPGPLDLVVADLGVLDLVFVGLESLPGPGQERFARDFVRTPGGGATMAIAAARLGLQTGLLPPLGDDEEGRLLRTLLHEENVVVLAAPAGRTPVTAILPVGGERAMASFDPPGGARPDLAALPPRAAIVPIDDIDGWPESTRRYVTVGDREAERYRGDLPPGLRTARVLFANEAEAIALSGEPTAVQLPDGVDGWGRFVVTSRALTRLSAGTPRKTCGSPGRCSNEGPFREAKADRRRTVVNADPQGRWRGWRRCLRRLR